MVLRPLGGRGRGGVRRRGRGRPRNAVCGNPPAADRCERTGDFRDSVIDSGTGDPVDFSLTVASRDSGNIKESISKMLLHTSKAGVYGAS